MGLEKDCVQSQSKVSGLKGDNSDKRIPKNSEDLSDEEEWS